MTTGAAELIERIAARDEAAMADFYRLFEARLYRFIKTKLNDSFEADDILNETFLEVWRKAGMFEGRSKVSTWLFGIAYYKTMDRLRARNPLLVSDELAPEVVDESAQADACVLAADDADHIRFCLDRLKAAHRAVLELAFFEDMSYGEIAKVVNCPEGTVKTRIFHAKQLMKHCLEGRMGVRR